MIRAANIKLVQPLLNGSIASASMLSHVAGLSQAAAGSNPQLQQQAAAGTSDAVLDEALLAKLVCPLAKTPLRYDVQQQLLINDELGVGYPVVKGVPYLMPSHGRMLHQEGQQAGNS